MVEETLPSNAETGDYTQPASILSIEGRTDIELRIATVDEGPALFDVLSKNGEHISEHQTSWALNATPETAAEHTRESVEKIATGDWLQYRVVETANPDAIVGSVTLYDRDRENHKVGLGYWIAQTATGKGYATDAARRLVQYGFEIWDVNTVELSIMETNSVSQEVARRIGAQLTDRLEPDPDDPEKTYQVWEITRS